jgi:ADP-heptose:LPS heptosyltransferase
VPTVLKAIHEFIQPSSEIKIIPKSANLWDLPDKEPLAGQDTHLIVRFRGIGDVGMTIFGLESLREKYPDDHITYLTSPESAALFCGQKGLVDKVIPMIYKHHALPDTVPIPIDISDYKHVYNLMNAVDFGDIAHIKPRADNFADLLSVTVDRQRPVRELIVSDTEQEAMRIRLGHKDDIMTWFIACQLDADGLPRRWFLDHWIKLSCLFLNVFPKTKLIFLGRDRVNQVLPGNVINLSGQTTVREFITAISLSELLICTDSSGLHIGGRLPISVLGIIGSTGKADNGEYAHTNYYHNVSYVESKRHCSPCWDWQHHTCRNRRHYPVCLWKISPKSIMELAYQILMSMEVM